MDAAIANQYIDLKVGYDWEVYDTFMDWLVIFVDVTVLMKYWSNAGERLHQLFNFCVSICILASHR